VVSLIDQ